MRLTGETQFCSPEHRRLYTEEHSRLGLERLLEEFSAKPKPAEVEPGPEDGADALPEPVLVSSGRDLRLWVFPPLPYRVEPQWSGFFGAHLQVADYTPGRPPAVAAHQEPATVPPVAPPSQNVAAKPPPPHETTPAPPAAVRSSPSSTSPEMNERLKPPGPPASCAEPPAVPSGATAPRDAGLPAPTFGGYMPKPRRESKAGVPAWRIAAGVVLALALGAGGYWGLEHSSTEGGSDNDSATAVQGHREGWIPNWSETGQGEEIALFGPSEQWSDYRVQWVAESADGVAWVFRASNPRNYYAIRLEKAGLGSWRLVRHTIAEGQVAGMSEQPLGGSIPTTGRVAVELEVKGSQFTLFLEGHRVAEWTDDQFDRGGFGVMRPDAGLAGVGDVKITQLGRESAGRRRFWRGQLPDRLPEVTMLRRGSDDRTADGVSKESSL